MSSRLQCLRRFVARISRRFLDENFDQISASLAFTTLLSLVPLVALMLSLVAMLPMFQGFIDQMTQYLVRNFLPDRNAGLIADYILRFSHKAAKVSLFGFLFLVGTAFLMLLTIERAFNHVWSVSASRPWAQRLRLYSVVLALWPLVLGGVAAGMSYAVTASLGFFNEPPWLNRFLLKAIAFGLAVVFLAALYREVPNTRVATRDSVWAAVVAAAGFFLMQKGFELYLAKFPSYTVVYGAFAVVPIFLVWLYLSWAVVLVGALVAATLPEFRRTKASCQGS